MVGFLRKGIFSRGCLFFVGAATLALLVGCAQPPDAPQSPFFARLLKSSLPEDYNGKHLLNPADQSKDNQIIGDLIKDGFRLTTYDGPMLPPTEYITCERTKHFGPKQSRGALKYRAYLSWGGVFTSSFFNAFRIEIVRNKNCELIDVLGYRVLQAL